MPTRPCPAPLPARCHVSTCAGGGEGAGCSCGAPRLEPPVRPEGPAWGLFRFFFFSSSEQENGSVGRWGETGDAPGLGPPGPRSSPARAPEGPPGGRQPPPPARPRASKNKTGREILLERVGEKGKKQKQKDVGVLRAPAGRWEGAGGAAARCAEVVSRRGSAAALGPAPRFPPRGELSRGKFKGKKKRKNQSLQFPA